MPDSSKLPPAQVRVLRGGLLSQLGNLRRLRDTYDRRAQMAVDTLVRSTYQECSDMNDEAKKAVRLSDADIAAELARAGAWNAVSADLTQVINSIERQQS